MAHLWLGREAAWCPGVLAPLRRRRFLRLTQAFLAPQPTDALAVDPQALPAEQGVLPAIAPPGVAGGECP
jgi:hypothetical protein